jgi:prepilin-type N-terminal cleavage/methylation domain-containing protein
MIIGMNRRGFTIVELLIVIVIMGMLLTLGVINLRGSQIGARDAERKADIESIATQLETYYTSGTDSSAATGDYPPTTLTATSSSMKQYLRDINTQSLIAPGVTDPTQTFISASNTNIPLPNINQYIYQPIQSDGTLCTQDSQECRKFNLYYTTETDNTVHTVTSKNQ